MAVRQPLAHLDGVPFYLLNLRTVHECSKPMLQCAVCAPDDMSAAVEVCSRHRCEVVRPMSQLPMSFPSGPMTQMKLCHWSSINRIALKRLRYVLSTSIRTSLIPPPEHSCSTNPPD